MSQRALLCAHGVLPPFRPQLAQWQEQGVLRGRQTGLSHHPYGHQALYPRQ
ncbi:hypothetical protein [Crocosphaera sp.]|uniref:hypothetical protein n=1 Tax=Crocosphaera sp. TaxID=2729996 RepID=UPI00257E6326|nr:hypothetical protein [Crocosphaera sp.]NQZ64156.1 hypothetical protein [Crocosphaera sp.]